MATTGGGTLRGDYHVDGKFSAKEMILSDGAVDDDAVGGGADIAAAKLEHRFQPVYAQPGGSASAAERKAVHVVHGATATLNGVQAGSRTACTGNATITIDVQKNGVSVLTSTFVLDSANTAYVTEAGTVSGGDLVQDDVIEVVVTVNAGSGTLGNGVFVALQIDEKAS